jgi:hypothetical protein
MAAFEYRQAQELREAFCKQAANRAKDRETLPRVLAFRDYWRRTQKG